MSSWYRPLDAGMWGDEKFRKLSRPEPSAQFLWIYLLTGEHTDGLPGLYRLGEAALAESIGWSVQELRPVFAELQSLRMALADFNARVIYLPNSLRYQGPNNAKHLQGWGKSFRRIPECSLKDTWLQQLMQLAQAKGIPYVEALRAGFDTVSDTVWHRVSPPNPNPHPHSNPKPKPNTHPHSNPNVGGLNIELPGNVDDELDPPEDIPFAEIIGHLNQRSGKRYRHGSEATKRYIRARWRDGFRLADFKRVIDAKCDEWLDTDMEKYLRPATLFGTKFESYVNERSEDDRQGGSLYPEMDQLMEQSHEASE